MKKQEELVVDIKIHEKLGMKILTKEDMEKRRLILNPMKNPLIIGYKGDIGSFILSGLLRVMPKALNIWCVDVNENEEEVIERIEKSDVVFLCIPLDMTIEYIMKYRNLLRNKIIIEQCSLKEWIYEDPRVRNFDIRSMHILFRPSQTPNLEDRKLGLFKNQFEDDMIDKLAEITQSEIVWYKDSKEHDEEMAIQQALTHRTLLILGKMLDGCNGSTYVSKKVMELSNRIKKGDIDLYKSIQENRHMPEKLNELEKAFEEFDIENYMGEK